MSDSMAGQEEEPAAAVNGSLSECRMDQPDTLMTLNDQQLARIGPVTLSVLRYSFGQMCFSWFVRTDRSYLPHQIFFSLKYKRIER